jgi:hypothetical protein
MSLEAFSLLCVTAQTHPPGYAFHKYWSRKPHNIVRAALQACGVRPGDVVLDPFCGSGVPLSEAAALGATCVGLDVNPVAVLLTGATLQPPDPTRFLQFFGALLNETEREFAPRYAVDGQPLHHAVHATVVVCGTCQRRVAADESAKRGRTYTCPRCAGRLAFNLENLVATRVVRVVLADGTQRLLDPPYEVAAANRNQHGGACDQPFEPNPRILAFRGMRTQDLFSERNFALLTHVARRIADLPADVQPAARLTLTAAVAQCSRLIAWRNDLTTGGPAWTVPGFWVPPLHLEMHPIAHLRARMHRTCKGFQHLAGVPGRGPQHAVHLSDAASALATLPERGRVAVAFVDPPYGDSVPFLEFSSLWNSFLGNIPDPGRDLAVSNRTRGDGSWQSYAVGMEAVAQGLKTVLRPDGKAIVTFNNKDLRAWQALLAALQQAGFRCQGAFYQHPAVVSAKAQLAPNGSYVGDVYSVFVQSAEAPTDDLAAVHSAVQLALLAAASRPSDGAVARVAMLAALRGNVDARVLDRVELRRRPA